jgi:heptosyltransferase-2
MKIVVFCPNLIGDTVMATPAIRALRRCHPDARLVGVIKSSARATLDGTTWFDEVHSFHPKSSNPEERTFGLVRRLRRERYDLAVLFPNSFRSALQAWLAGIPRRVGYARGGRDLLLTDRLTPPLDGSGRFLVTPAVEYYLAIARHLGCPPDSVHLELATTPDDEAAADSVWNALKLPAVDRVVCLNTGGAFGPAKSWPNPYFATLGRRIADELGYSVLVLCGPGERDNAREIARLAGHPRVVTLADQPLSLGLSKACVRRSSLLITTDSGPRHFAAAFNVPVVSLFGPTHIGWTRTNHPRAIHLQHRVPCGPCQRPVCHLRHHRCMTELLPETVYNAAARLLRSQSDRVRNPLNVEM